MSYQICVCKIACSWRCFERVQNTSESPFLPLFAIRALPNHYLLLEYIFRLSLDSVLFDEKTSKSNCKQFINISSIAGFLHFRPVSATFETNNCMSNTLNAHTCQTYYRVQRIAREIKKHTHKYIITIRNTR